MTFHLAAQKMPPRARLLSSPHCLLWSWLYPQAPQGGPKGRSEISFIGKMVAAAPNSHPHDTPSRVNGMVSSPRTTTRERRLIFSQNPSKYLLACWALIGFVPVSKLIQLTWGVPVVLIQVAVPVVLSLSELTLGTWGGVSPMQAKFPPKM